VYSFVKGGKKCQDWRVGESYCEIATLGSFVICASHTYRSWKPSKLII